MKRNNGGWIVYVVAIIAIVVLTMVAMWVIYGGFS
jgi:hypothetical protein